MLRYLIIFIIYLLPFQGLTQVSPLVSHLDNKQGFDNSSVWAFLQDEKGFMWFGTSSGLWRYDGYTLTKFQYNSSDTTSISDNFTFSLFKDSRDRMWVGTLHGGVNLYNPITNSFQRCFPKDTVMLGSQINEFAEDAMGNIWIASSRGLHKYDGEKLQHLFISKNNPVSNLRNQIRSLYVSRSGIIWLGGYGMGIGSYDPISKKINQLQDYRMNKVANIRRIQEDEAGNLFWIEGTNPTFNRFSPKTNLFYKLSAQEIMGIPGRLWDFSIVGDIIYLATSEGVFALRYSANSLIESIQNISEMYGLPNMNRFHLYIEENKKLWIGTEDSGILGVKLFPLHNIYKNPFPDKNLSDIWHGKGKTFYDFDGKGLWIIDSVRKKTNLIPVQKQGLGFEGKTIHTLAEDGKENLWIGTPEGLFMADFLKNKVKKFTNTADKNSISSSFISTLFIDSKKSIWVLAGGNWNVFNEKYQNFSKGNKKPGSGHSLMYLVETAEGIWVGSMDGGLVLVNRNTYKPIQYFAFDALNPNSISNNSIMALYTDHHGALWVGTNNGLNQYLAKLGSFKRYNLTDGIPEESIIQISGSGNYLAVQTTSGLYQSNLDEPENKFTKIKSPINFVPANGILHYPYFTWKQGNYLSELNINNLPQDTVPPPIAITGFQLDPNNKNQLSLAEQNLNPSYRKHITLQYDQNLFSIEFAVLSFNETKTNQYAYTLEGFDKTWTESGSRRFVTYTNLNPGEYTFRARGATQQGIWSKEDATFTITILPPPWKTWWAYTLYSIGFIGLLFLGRRATVNRERLKAQVAIEQTEKQTLKELDHLKTKFFSNITHEFRTPLTLIQGPANELFEKERNQESKQLLGLIKSNSDRLLKLINQLLDLAKLDALEMKINASSVNIKSLINVTASQFNSLATSKGIDYMLHIADDLPIAIADREKIETMLFNLISNAIKFTETGGHVKVHASWMNQTFILQVSDTGRGIPAAKLKHIFDRFYQVNPTDSSHSEGTGIGLALVKEYTELMKGILEVESTVGAGTVFTIKLPLKIFEASDILHHKALEDNKSLASIRQDVFSVEDNLAHNGLPVLLLVEDNPDIRFFIKTCLGTRYHYKEAQHGKEGLTIARDEVPDLVISDWMMPEMDGVELCKEIRKDKRTDHIPFIMLTAKAGDDNKMEGLQRGADDYLIKPFNKEELVLKVQNLIAQREKLQDHIKKALLAQGTDLKPVSAEEKFIVKARTYVELKMADELLNVETLADEMNLSREQCYRKIMALTGFSPSVFIRKLRLHKAAQLLAAKAAPVSQVAYEVGYGNLSHFSKAFKEEFGKLPSEFEA